MSWALLDNVPKREHRKSGSIAFTTMDGATIWDGLPVAICSDILAILGTSDVVAVSSTCTRWRAVVQSSITCLAPKTVLAMPFVRGCSALKQLQLGQAVPTDVSGQQLGPFIGFSHIAAVTTLTSLCLATSSTAIWQGTAAALAAEQLQHITALTLLQVLDLSHQELLSTPCALRPLIHLNNLTSLILPTSGDLWHLPYSSWRDIAALTGLKHLDISGCDRAWLDQYHPLQRQHLQGCQRTECQDGPELVSAPLHILSRLSHLQSLIMADWLTSPTAKGMLVLAQLPALTALELDHGMYCIQPAKSGQATQQDVLKNEVCRKRQEWNSKQQDDSLLDLLRGAHKSQLQENTAVDSSVSSSSSSGDACFFNKLQSLRCAGALGSAQLVCSDALWAALPSLTCLNLTSSWRFTAQGLMKLQQLQMLVLLGCPQLDYDSLAAVLACCSCLRHLDLQNSTVILNTGRTATLLLQGKYKPPAAAWRDTPSTCSSSRGNAVAGIMSAAAQAPAAGHAGLQVLMMSGCDLALQGAGITWYTLPENINTPEDASVLLYHLVCHAKQGLSNLRVLHWAQCKESVGLRILCDLVPAARGHLEDLDLSSSILPNDQLLCWQILAASTNLRTLDLSHVGFRLDHLNSLRPNPAAELLPSVACMQGLETLRLAGWRYCFENFHVLAALSKLQCLDLSKSRVVTDEALCSLTHLTGLTKLNVSSAAPSSPQIWGLIFFHLTLLQHLDLSKVANFNSSSVAGLTQLSRLTSLDIRGTKAGDETAVNQLVKLSSCKRLFMTLMPSDNSCNSSRGRRSRSLEVQHLDLTGSEVAAEVHQQPVAGAATEAQQAVYASSNGPASQADETAPMSIMQSLRQAFRLLISYDDQQQQQQQPQRCATAERLWREPRGFPNERRAEYQQHDHVWQAPSEQQQQQQPDCRIPWASTEAHRAANNRALSSTARQLTGADQLEEFAFVSRFSACQSLRQLVLDAGPAVAKYCGTLLSPWIAVG